MSFLESLSLTSIQEESSPVLNEQDADKQKYMDGVLKNTNQQEDIESPLNPFVIREKNSPTTPFSPMSCKSTDDIEIKKTQLLEKYRNSPTKKKSFKLFQNKLQKKLQKSEKSHWAIALHSSATTQCIKIKKPKQRRQSLTKLNKKLDLSYRSNNNFRKTHQKSLDQNSILYLSNVQLNHQLFKFRKIKVSQSINQSSIQTSQMQKIKQNYQEKKKQLQMLSVVLLLFFGSLVLKIVDIFQ